jgi:hypothetical protein
MDGNMVTSRQDVLQLEEIAYILSNVRLQTTSGKFYTVPNSYHLVRQSSRFGAIERMRITIPNIPAGDYKEVEFLIGVDSLRNFRIDQVGDLDPNNGMAWDWNTGYKFFVMEGRVLSNDTMRSLVYHVGDIANLRLRQQQTVATAFKMTDGGTVTRKLNFDVNKVFSSSHIIDPKAVRNVMGGPRASELADNVRDAITILVP